MPQSNIIITAGTEFELLTRKKAIEKVNGLTTDQLKRILKLVESPKAINYLSSDIKFAILQKFL